MNITVLGAAGKTGLHVVGQALQQGHQVTALVRHPEAFDVSDEELTVVVGDARETADLSKAFAGTGAVISTLGSMRDNELIRRSTRSLIEAARQTSVRRVVLMSSFLVADNYRPGLGGKLMGAMMKSGLADRSAGEAELAGSDLDWTIVCPTSLDKAPAGSPVRVVDDRETVSMSNGIARADAAAFLLHEATSPGHPRSKIVITSK